ncbi:hypothetical protein AB0L13_11450 [Saccharopolyspora shandongensis]|uniref:hypothetical protein n=1 Tax=Saccharopolyspora shandongensis TaxID=418495 RepID=UPI0034334413
MPRQYHHSPIATHNEIGQRHMVNKPTTNQGQMLRPGAFCCHKIMLMATVAAIPTSMMMPAIIKAPKFRDCHQATDRTFPIFVTAGTRLITL